MKVLVLYNEVEKQANIESEEDTKKSALWLKNVLIENGYEVDSLGVKTSTLANIKMIKCDLVFNLIEWTGKDVWYGVKAINLLEELKIPYTGSNAKYFQLVCDKNKMKKEMLKIGIPTPKYQIFVTGREKVLPLPYPVIIKPAEEHCGVGVNQKSVIENETDLKKIITIKVKEFNQPVLVEQFIEGREFHVTVLEKKGKPWVLPPAEVIFLKKPGFRHVLTYAGKWHEDSAEYGLSSMQAAKIDSVLYEKIKCIAELAYVKLGGRDYPRLDMRYDGNNIYVLEINNNPGIDYETDSGIGVSARAAGLSEEGLIKHIAENAWWRWKN